MITAQDIREKTFEKSRIGGYDMAAVDNFLEELADDVTASQKENAVLKSKMKVLVDKIEEYRANEEALQLSILSAQKLAVQIENDAKTRAAALLEDADKQVKARIGGIEDEVKRQEKRLEEAKSASDKFIESVRAMCNAQLKNIEAISSGIVRTEKPAPAKVEDTQAIPAADGIEEAVSRIQKEPQIQMDLGSEMDAPPAKRKRNLDSTQPFSF